MLNLFGFGLVSMAQVHMMYTRLIIQLILTLYLLLYLQICNFCMIYPISLKVHLAQDIAQLVELRSCNWVVAISS